MQGKPVNIVCIAALLLFSSCGSSVLSDAQEAAAISCKIQTLMRTTRFEDSMEERVGLERDAQKLELKLKRKYDTKAAWQQFMDAYYTALNKCAEEEVRMTGKNRAAVNSSLFFLQVVNN